jgi:Ser-tRNA(Ala) deacylase AlaX
MAFTFQGDFVVKRKPDEVYDLLSDPNRFCPLLPDFEKLTAKKEALTAEINQIHLQIKAAREDEQSTTILIGNLEQELDEIRTVTISGCAPIPCGGTHVADIAQIGRISIIRAEPMPNLTFRLHFSV